MESEQAPERSSGLKAIWANTLEPVAPLPWYRRVPLKLVTAGAVVVGLATALTVAAVTGAGAPPPHRILLPEELGYQVRMPEDGNARAARGYYQRRLTALSPYREVTVAGYGTAGTTETTLTVIGLTGIFSDPQQEVLKYFGRLGNGDAGGETVTEVEDFPAGPLGGQLMCAVLVYPSTSETACVWADGSTVGIVVDHTGAGRTEDVAQNTLEVRAAVEVEAKD
ncbi:hypothetical protein ACGF13_18885 [Kitasatospora sp. NPDC048286]|uniref:hypothetical protein n=1 Tax=Kitasatospora sp. NPDC048286 TaxID=3364047 RepID=UPI003718E42A